MGASSAALSWAPGVPSSPDRAVRLFSWTFGTGELTPSRNQLLTKITSYHQMWEGLLSQLKNTMESGKDLVGVSLII